MRFLISLHTGNGVKVVRENLEDATRAFPLEGKFSDLSVGKNESTDLVTIRGSLDNDIQESAEANLENLAQRLCQNLNVAEARLRLGKGSIWVYENPRYEE